MRMYLMLALENNGREVIGAASLEEARENLDVHKSPTCALLDLELPDGHGLDLIRDLPTGTPVVALTADVSREIELQCRRAGCAAVLAKADTLDTVLDVINGISGQQRNSAAVEYQNGELAHRYSKYLAEVRIDIDRARAGEDLEQVRKILHRLRGTAVHFGYSGISESTRDIGIALAAGNSDRIDSALDKLNEQLLAAT